MKKAGGVLEEARAVDLSAQITMFCMVFDVCSCLHCFHG